MSTNAPVQLQDYTVVCKAGVPSDWVTDVPNAHFWDLQQCDGFVTIEIQNYQPMLRRMGQTGEVQRGIKRFRILSPIDQTVVISMGDDRDTNDPTAGGSSGPFAPLVVTETGTSTPFTVDLSGYVEGTFAVNFNAAGYLAIISTIGGRQDYAAVYDEDGFFLGHANGNGLSLTSGRYRLDLTGVTRLTFFPSASVDVGFQADRFAGPLPLLAPTDNKNNALVNTTPGPNNGTIDTNVFKNRGDKMFSAHLTLNMSNPASSMIFELIPVDANGNSYDGDPGYLTRVAGGGEIFLNWPMNGTPPWGDIKGVGPMVVTGPGQALSMGGFDYKLRFKFQPAVPGMDTFTIAEMSTSQSR